MLSRKDASPDRIYFDKCQKINYVAMQIFVAIFNSVTMHIFVIKTKSPAVISPHIDIGMIGTIVLTNSLSFDPDFKRLTW